MLLHELVPCDTWRMVSRYLLDDVSVDWARYIQHFEFAVCEVA